MSDNFQKQLDKLVNIFLQKNSQINLSAIRDPKEVKIKHIQDSLELNKILKIPAWAKILDIWTWWGFPLLPLAITNPQAHFVGLDARNKKIKAIQDMVHQIGLKNVDLVRSRIEDHKGDYDIITARALGYIDKLLNRTKHLLKKWTKVALYKQFSEQELADMQKLLPQYGLHLSKSHHYKLFDDDIERVIYVVEKK